VPPEHDERLFITVHQVYELWFHQILCELDALRVHLSNGIHSRSFEALRRLCRILRTLVAQVEIMETMSPTSFGSFRALLQSSSGMQSTQFREIELVCGRTPDPGLLQTVLEAASPEARERLERRMHECTVFGAFLAYLRASGYRVGVEHRPHEADADTDGEPVLHATLEEIYHADPPTTQLCELLVDFDSGFQEWRYRHVKMVERTIGSKTGTGGSSGIAYLRGTLFQPFFPELWAVRDRL